MKLKIVLIALLMLSVFAKAQYWQQEVNYDISVTLNDEKHELYGVETMEYINNSPDELSFIYIHLWPNAYKDNSTAFAKQQLKNNKSNFHFAKEEKRGWIDNIDFTVDEQDVKWMYEEGNIDIAKIILNKPLKSGEKAIIKTPFKVKIPHTFSRLGHVNQSYQISQWYPKPAVYDKTGWHQMPYLDQGEFYSEFGSFNVEITLPSNYVVAATGVLQEQEEKEWLHNRQKIKVKTADNFTSSEETKTITFVQDNVHDFAWFADKHYNVVKGEVILPHSLKKVDTWFMYTIDSPTRDYSATVEKAMKDLHDALYVYSLWVGDYPYSAATAVTGALGAGGGMEYPMVTVTAPMAIIHEVGHNWFYGILATNERDFGWMDEGLNSFFENKTYDFQKQNEPKKEEEDDKKKKKSFGFSFSSADSHKATAEAIETRNINQPVHHHSNSYNQANYFIQLYQKPVMLMEYLEDYLGEEMFMKCWHNYYNEWQFKHPYIEDMKIVFEKTSGKDLSWLFDDIILQNKTLDAKIRNVKKDGEKLRFTIGTDIKAPIRIDAYNKDKKMVASRWAMIGSSDTNYFVHKDIHYFRINDSSMIFKTTTGKFSRVSGLKKCRLPQFSYIAGIPAHNRTNISYLLPLTGYNSFDGLTLGAAFYNTGLRSNKVNYFLSPMYGVKSKTLTGLATLNAYFYPKKDFSVYEWNTTLQSFAGYSKLQTGLSHWSKKEIFGVTWRQKINFKNAFIFDMSGFIAEEFMVSDLSYNLNYRDGIKSLSLKASSGYYSQVSTLVSGSSSIRSGVELEGSMKYKKGKAVRTRIYGGYSALLSGNSNIFIFRLDGGIDYLREYYFIDRNQSTSTFTMYNRQTNGGDGGFRASSNIFSTSIFSNNTTFDLPISPFSIYTDVAYTLGQLHYGSGLSMNLIDGYFEFYLPIFGSHYTDKLPSNIGDLGANFRFLLKLPLKSSNEVIWSNL